MKFSFLESPIEKHHNMLLEHMKYIHMTKHRATFQIIKYQIILFIIILYCGFSWIWDVCEFKKKSKVAPESNIIALLSKIDINISALSVISGSLSIYFFIYLDYTSTWKLISFFVPTIQENFKQMSHYKRWKALQFIGSENCLKEAAQIKRMLEKMTFAMNPFVESGYKFKLCEIIVELNKWMKITINVSSVFILHFFITILYILIVQDLFRLSIFIQFAIIYKTIVSMQRHMFNIAFLLFQHGYLTYKYYKHKNATLSKILDRQHIHPFTIHHYLSIYYREHIQIIQFFRQIDSKISKNLFALYILCTGFYNANGVMSSLFYYSGKREKCSYMFHVLLSSIVQLLAALATGNAYIYISNQLNSMSPLLYRSQTIIPGPPTFIKLRLLNFVECSNAKRSNFRFRFGCFGFITRRAMIQALFWYASISMLLSPTVRQF